eukprot:GFUD01004917.1.p1 GENE.GFUD01004917.1~~GFUD01004917.1.p1  ORF type:complete len:115 (+),score=9.55 GFUD01004917.1:1181-1525(+)
MQKTSEDPYEEESRRGLLPGKGGVGHSSLQHVDLDAIKTEAGSVLLLARVRAGLPLSSFQAVPSTDVMDLALLLVSCSSAAADYHTNTCVPTTHAMFWTEQSAQISSVPSNSPA